jgi:hypothetical protein
MAVTSRELPATEPARRRSSQIWPLGLVAIITGCIFWPLGARYSLEGWIQFLNLLLGLVRLPARLPMPTGWWWLLFVPLGLLYSAVELLVRPGLPASWHQMPSWLLALALLLLVHGTDIGSTLFGYLLPPANAWAIHRWAAGEGLWALVLWSLALTYLPEHAIKFGLKWLGLEILWTRGRKSDPEK